MLIRAGDKRATLKATYGILCGRPFSQPDSDDKGFSEWQIYVANDSDERNDLVSRKTWEHSVLEEVIVFLRASPPIFLVDHGHEER